MNRQELVVKIIEAQIEKDGGVTATGVLEVLNEGYGRESELCGIGFEGQERWPAVVQNE